LEVAAALHAAWQDTTKISANRFCLETVVVMLVRVADGTDEAAMSTERQG
jgi:hypothetical protein